MKNENFLFGCGAFDVLCYVNATEESEKEKYGMRTKEWLALFNYGTLPFYWGTYEPTEGDVRQAEMDKCVEFLTARGVTLKGHPLCWHTVCADWLLSYDDKTIFEKQLERINREVSHFKGKITYWDVINETVILPVFNKYDNAVSRICARYGRMTLIKEVFAAAKAADPEAQLLINDFNTTDKYEKVIEECLQAGVPIDAIGIQSHQHQGYWGAKKIKEVIERFSRFGLPVHFTENTLLSGMLMPPEIEDLNDYQVESWDTVPFMEIRQQEDLAEMYGILLNSPSVKAATYWDFADGAWLNAPSGLVRVDGTPKPAYDRLKSIVESRHAVK
jgi:endo-1,4-beta-xylanase